MAINLNNLNISIHEFQRISSGEFNAGEVALASTTKLDKINHHVSHLSFMNGRTMRHETVIAIKNAFVRALTDYGVGEDRIREIRQKLGISPANGPARELYMRSIKPLSRQEVREILDANADAINADIEQHHQGEAKIRTTQELYEGGDMSQENKRLRDATNAPLSDLDRVVHTNRDILSFQYVLAGKVDDGYIRRDKLLKTAESQLDQLLKDCQNSPREGYTAWATLKLQGGQTVVLPTDMDEAQYAQRLEDVIVHLKAHVPATTAKAFNKAIRDGIMAGGGDLPASFKNIVNEARKAVNECFGDAKLLGLIPDGAPLIDPARLARLIPTGDDAERITCGGIREAIIKAAKETAASCIVETKLKEAYAAVNRAAHYAPRLLDEFIARHADAFKDIVDKDRHFPITTVIERLPDLCSNFIEEHDAFVAAHAPQAFQEIDGAGQARARGYYESEIPMIEKAFVLYMSATGCSADEAMSAALDPLSNARRLFGYGGRFTESTENFRQGLRLMEKFQEWYTTTVNAVAGGDHDPASPTKSNLHIGIANLGARAGVEKFVFEELAVNPSADLHAEDGEAIFGMGSNRAMRFIARGHANSLVGTLATIPPDKRGLIYDVSDIVDPMPRNPEERNAYKALLYMAPVVLRALRRYDQLEALRKTDGWNRDNVLKMLLDDFNIPPHATNRQINLAIHGKLMPPPDVNAPNPIKVKVMEDNAAISGLFISTGAQYEDCRKAVEGTAAMPELPRWASPMSCELSNLDGTANGGRATMLNDICRPTGAKRISDKTEVLENAKFVFNFPDGSRLRSKTGAPGDPEVVANNNAIADKVATLSDDAHPAQLSSLYYALSQSALAKCRGGFRGKGLETNEHMAVTFTLMKDAATGSITIAYTHPEGFPAPFIWTTTIALDGTATTTPIAFPPEPPPGMVPPAPIPAPGPVPVM